jgi:Prophage minor tail protein Z (GPZ)
MGLLDVKVDTSKFEEWCDEISSRGLKNAIRRAVDTSATAARKVALKTIAADIGVPVARIKDAVGKVKRTTQTNLSASFTTTKKAINILATGATASRQGGVTGSTFRLTGGGSAHLVAPHAFVMTVGGNRFIVQRRGKERLPVRGLFAGSPSTAMGQEGAAAQVAWKKAADAELSQRLGREVQRQFFSEKLSASTPADTGD